MFCVSCSFETPQIAAGCGEESGIDDGGGLYVRGGIEE
jgi:hypothetical protein